MKHIGWLVLTIVAAVVHTAWPDFLRFQGVQPDLVLLLVVYFGLTEGEERAMWTGALGGIYLDTIAETTLGHHVLALVITGYLAGRISTRLITDHPAVKAAMVFVAVVFNGVVFLAITFVQQSTAALAYAFFASVIPTAFYSAIVTFLVFGVLSAMARPRAGLARGFS